MNCVGGFQIIIERLWCMTDNYYHCFSRDKKHIMETTTDFQEIFQEKEFGYGLYFCIGKTEGIPNEFILLERGSIELQQRGACVLQLSMKPDVIILDMKNPMIIETIQRIKTQLKSKNQTANIHDAQKLFIKRHMLPDKMVAVYAVDLQNPITRKTYKTKVGFLLSGKPIDMTSMKIVKLQKEEQYE